MANKDVQAREGHTWYLPHHPVLHPQKPQKPRIVFDCAAKYEDVSLKDQLLQGPDMTNTLVRVLSRFRQEPTAFMADIEAMFCQVKVSPMHRDVLKFLWWKDDDYNQPAEEYRMSVHPFGAKSSPSCAGFCLRKTADEYESEFDSLSHMCDESGFLIGSQQVSFFRTNLLFCPNLPALGQSNLLM